MIQLQILSGKMAGSTQAVRRFPFRIGRAAGCELRLEESGVWDQHLTLDFQRRDGYYLHAAPEAFVAVNDHPQTSVRLGNGDVIAFGAAKLQFWLTVPRQRGLFLREAVIWLLLAGVTAGQVALIFWLEHFFK
jgi:hypothetical protein